MQVVIKIKWIQVYLNNKNIESYFKHTVDKLIIN